MKLKPSALIVGHISLDMRNGQLVLGGPPMYQIPILLAGNFEIDVVTSFATDAVPFIPDFITSEVNLVNLNDSKTTTKFEFVRNEKAERELTLLSKADNLEFNSFQHQLKNNYDIVIVSPIANEIDRDNMERFSQLGSHRFFDVQGIARKIDPFGKVSNNLSIEDMDWSMKTFNFVKASHLEISNIESNLHNYNSHLIITHSGSKIEFIGKTEKVEFITEKEKLIKDDTGSGDIFLASFASKFVISDMKKRLKYADIVTRLNLDKIGIPNKLIIDKIRDLDFF